MVEAKELERKENEGSRGLSSLWETHEERGGWTSHILYGQHLWDFSRW